MTNDLAKTFKIERLTAGYGGELVIDDVTLPPLRPGEVTALVGPNAAGKSTLLRAMAGFLPAKGTRRYGDAELSGLSIEARSSLVGFMPQSLPESTGLTVLEGVLAALLATRLDATDRLPAHERAHQVLEELGIAHLAMKSLAQLSGGQRQVASLAQAIARDPKILLLDEPTSVLDLARQFHVMLMVRTIARKGRIAVVVLHDLALAAQWADRIVVLNRGRVHNAGTPHEAVTSGMLADVYRVVARVECCSQGRLQIMTDGMVRSLSAAGEIPPDAVKPL